MTQESTAGDEGPLPALKRRGAVFVERATRRWIALDPEGNFWVLPAGDDPWHHRQPFEPSEDTDLDPVPGHYKTALGLPF